MRRRFFKVSIAIKKAKANVKSVDKKKRPGIYLKEIVLKTASYSFLIRLNFSQNGGQKKKKRYPERRKISLFPSYISAQKTTKTKNKLFVRHL